MRYIAFLMMLGLFATSLPANAAISSAKPGQLIKASGDTVYYYGTNDKRYVFPTERTYKSWYGEDWSGVVTISDAELQSIPLGGNVTYRPGVKLLKITTDPRVYAVSSGGTLRWIDSEALAIELYGADWAKNVDDLPDPFYINYRQGSHITQKSDFNPSGEKAEASSIWKDKGMGAPVE
jgi:hypothetical protein